MEYLDVVDENNNLTNEVLDRKTIHERNLFHRHVSSWIINEKGEVLLQQRALTKLKSPGKWARTGGHVDSKEMPIDAIKREVYEEVGILVSDENIIETEIFKSKQKENFFTYNYIFLVDTKIEDYVIQKEEVEQVKYFTLEELEDSRKNNDESFNLTKWPLEDFICQINILKKIREDILNKKLYVKKIR